MTPQPPIPPDLLAYAGTKYRQGQTIRAIAAAIGYSYGATRNGLLRSGVQLRRRGQRGIPMAFDILEQIDRALADPTGLVRRPRPVRHSGEQTPPPEQPPR